MTRHVHTHTMPAAMRACTCPQASRQLLHTRSAPHRVSAITPRRPCCLALQYEVALPLSIAGDCLAALTAELYGPRARWRGFRSPALLRFVGGALPLACTCCNTLHMHY